MKRQITSSRLNVNAGIMSWYVKSLEKLAKEMTKECRQRLSEIYRELSPQISFDESISSQARIALNELNKKYSDLYSAEAKRLSQSLITKTNKYANWQFTQMLKDMLGDKAKDFGLSGSAISPEKAGSEVKWHSNPKTEENRRQIAITAEDFERILEIIYVYDNVFYQKKFTPVRIFCYYNIF